MIKTFRHNGLEAWFTPTHGGRVGLWLGQQIDYDLWQARQKARPIIQSAKQAPHE
jgi:plasmid maintenance system antidote protein VapI